MVTGYRLFSVLNYMEKTKFEKIKKNESSKIIKLFTIILT